MSNHVKQRTEFLSNVSVARRIYMLIFIPLLILVVSGIFTINALNKSRSVLSDINNQVFAIDQGNILNQRMQRDFVSLMHEVYIGSKAWDDGVRTINILEKDLNDTLLPAYRKALELTYKADQTAKIDESMKAVSQLKTLLESGKTILKAEDRARLELYLQNDLPADTLPIKISIQQDVERSIQFIEEAFLDAQNRVSSFMNTNILLTLAGTLLAATLGYLIYRSIANSIERLTGTMRQISAGNLEARVELKGKNELVELGDNFDRMVEDRIATQAKIDRDHQQLNQSVSDLLDAVFDLSERNLTVRAKVTEDATGPLADAINQLAEDTADVLKQVRDIAIAVETTSQDVNRYALSVNEMARIEQSEAEETTTQVDNILQRLDAIAQSAQSANSMADTTANTTRHAQQTVSRSMENMGSIRDTVQETGKRLKRLGERSQEISQIIDVINNLSERTTVLALNASMQATAAGDAGRGFSMIAEEIQRLAESSRDSTNQISTLVRNIQQEANTTISTMDRTIEQVVNGSTLAEEAAQQMQATLEATNQLVNSVEKIAESSAAQVAISKSLQTRAERILDATQTTGKELLSLTKLTRNMAEYGQRLVQSVNVFKLDT